MRDNKSPLIKDSYLRDGCRASIVRGPANAKAKSQKPKAKSQKPKAVTSIELVP